MSNLKLDVHTSEGKTNGSVDLPAEIFDTEASIALMHQVVCLLYTSDAADE